MVTVGRGDTVYELAQRYNVPMREVIELNRLSPPYALVVGQRLKLPTARFYTVQRGDTMYGISRMHQVGMSELARANGLQEPYAIRVGQQLQLPGGGGVHCPDGREFQGGFAAASGIHPGRTASRREADGRRGGIARDAATTATGERSAGRYSGGAPARPIPSSVSGTAGLWDGAIRGRRHRRRRRSRQSVPAPVSTPAPVEAARAPSAQPIVQPPARSQVAALPPRPAPVPAPASHSLLRHRRSLPTPFPRSRRVQPSRHKHLRPLPPRRQRRHRFRFPLLPLQHLRKWR